MNTNVNPLDEQALLSDLAWLTVELTPVEEAAQEAAEEAAETLRRSLMTEVQQDAEDAEYRAKMQRFFDAETNDNANASLTRSGRRYSERKAIHS